MIALDTNVLIRMFVEDTADPETRLQNERARLYVTRATTSGDRFYVSEVVVCEAVWVLRSRFRLVRQDVLRFLADLLNAESFVSEDRERAIRALTAYSAGRADFADYLIREHARGAGCEHVVTFDDALLREDGFVAP